MDANFENGCAIEESGEVKGLTVGNSMLPLFRSKKDIVTVTRNYGELRVNDVLLYRKKGTDDLILHRLLKITDNGFIIRGDNRFSKETNVTPDDIVGVVKSFERNGKYYDCETSKAYKAYVIYIRASYPLRRLLHKFRSFIKVVKRKTRKLIHNS